MKENGREREQEGGEGPTSCYLGHCCLSHAVALVCVVLAVRLHHGAASRLVRGVHAYPYLIAVDLVRVRALDLVPEREI